MSFKRCSKNAKVVLIYQNCFNKMLKNAVVILVTIILVSFMVGTITSGGLASAKVNLCKDPSSDKKNWSMWLAICDLQKQIDQIALTPGPPGPPGPTGATGPPSLVPGPQGETGPSGVLGVYSKGTQDEDNGYVFLYGLETKTYVMRCLTGDLAVGGEVLNPINDPDLSIIGSESSGSDGWLITVHSEKAPVLGTPPPILLHLAVRCLDVP
jgi:hypothetical protein